MLPHGLKERDRYQGGDEGRRDAEREVKVNEHLQDD